MALKKTLYLLSLVLVFSNVLISKNVLGQSVTFPPNRVPSIKDDLVLRFSYTGCNQLRSWGKRQIGFFHNPNNLANPNESDEFYMNSFNGVVLATDVKKQLYLYDPVKEQRSIRVFNHKGNEVRRWNLPKGFIAVRAVVTASRIVWISVKSENAKALSLKSGIPLLAYKTNSSQPFINWTRQIPKPVLVALGKRRVNKSSVNASDDSTTSLPVNPNVSDIFMQSGGKKLVISIYGFGKNLQNVNMSIDLSERGDIYKCSVSPYVWKMDYAFVAPSEKRFYAEVDATPQHPNWTKMWLWWVGGKRGLPIFTREMLNNPLGWWVQTLGTTQSTQLDAPILDGRGQIYTTIHRRGEHGDTIFSPIGSLPLTFKPAEDYSLVVLNPKRQAIGYLPWKSTYLSSNDEWIFPVPDGSGFYRQEFTAKELCIYWHALPNFKPTPPRKVFRKRR